MTNLEAVKGEIAPFTADKLQIEKALIDNNLTGTTAYSITNSKAIAKVSIIVLTSFLALASESEGNFSQSYDKAGLLSKIAALAKSNGLEDMLSGVGTTIINGSMYW
jgi:hypothetical protein